MSIKKFKESHNTAVFTTKYIVQDKRDITCVFHYLEDGAWQFSSDDQIDNYEEVTMVVGLGEIIKLDNTILDLADLAEGYFAERKSKKDQWIIREIAD